MDELARLDRATLLNTIQEKAVVAVLVSSTEPIDMAFAARTPYQLAVFISLLWKV